MCEPPAVRGFVLRQAVIEPLHDTRDATEILIDIADRCGFLAVLERLPELSARPHRPRGPRAGARPQYSNDELMDRFCRAATTTSTASSGSASTATWSPSRPRPSPTCPSTACGSLLLRGDQDRRRHAARAVRGTGFDWDTSELRAAPPPGSTGRSTASSPTTRSTRSRSRRRRRTSPRTCRSR